MSILTKIQTLDSDLFYDRYYGTDNSVVLTLKNAFFPERYIERLRYNRKFSFLKNFCKSTPLPKHKETPEVLDALKQLKEDGIVILPAYAKDVAKALVEKYNIYKTEEIHDGEYHPHMDITKPDKLLLNYLSDEFILSLVGKYYNAQPYLRMVPHASRDYVNQSLNDLLQKTRDPKNLNYNIFWHFDTVNLINVHLLLDDSTKETTHMIYAKKSHKKPHINLTLSDGNYSEEYIKKNYEVVHCVGPAGTIYIFDTNGLHRMNPQKDTYRAFYGQMITPGNNMLPAKKLSIEDSALKEMSPLQRAYFKYLI